MMDKLAVFCLEMTAYSMLSMFFWGFWWCVLRIIIAVLKKIHA